MGLSDWLSVKCFLKWWKWLQGLLGQSPRTLNQIITRHVPGCHFLNPSFTVFLIPVCYQNTFLPFFFLMSRGSFSGFYDSKMRTGNFEQRVTLSCLIYNISTPPAEDSEFWSFLQALDWCVSVWCAALLGLLCSWVIWEVIIMACKER